MYYLIQKGLFKSWHESKLLDILDRVKLEYEWVDCKPFISTIDFNTDKKDIFCFGSIKMAQLAINYNWKPGSFYNSNHDYEVYSQYYKDNLLNYDSIVMNLQDKLTYPNREFFARPCGDNKAFEAKYYTKDSWELFVKYPELNNLPEKYHNCRVQICSLKNIQQEIRCWIIKGKVITASQYKIGKKVHYYNLDFYEEVINFAESMTSIYNPAEAYVMDVCLSDDKWKIVEINCINAAGFYDCNLQKLLYSLEENFNEKV